ncbi:PREDICTED: uncharacterized protein LOC109166480 [Ipomoea nil]|uniref:uncharacterized protein LOC109166480 n=1 Tax=Ipomoea nil TaxID=35883 RepID=UPI0009012824|nr:PREDICTED: uncharacterized protein LOC109166480 [Ipomoea nil]
MGQYEHVALNTTVTAEPTCYSQAVKYSEWRDAMDLEFNALWVFRTKRKFDGSIERHKARLVTKGFNQVTGEDFFETFSPVVKPTTRYMNDILKRAGMVDCKPVSTPISTTKAVSGAEVPYADPTQYRSLAGALQYLMVTRPDLSYVVNRLCQHMHSPTTTDWATLKRVLRYVNGTLNLGLHMSSSACLDIHAYSDADWAGDPDDRKSTSGFAVFLENNLISWVRRKHRIVARSSTEAEYKGLADVSAEVTWLVSLMKEIDISPTSAPKLWCGEQLKIRTSWTAENPGRRFWQCVGGNRKVGCGFIDWYDTPMCYRSKRIIPGLLKRINRQDEEIRKLNSKLRSEQGLKSMNKVLVVLIVLFVAVVGSRVW